MSISWSFPLAIFLSAKETHARSFLAEDSIARSLMCKSTLLFNTILPLLCGYHEGFPSAVTSNFVVKTYYRPSLAASWQFWISIAHWYIWQFSWFTVYSSSKKLHGFYGGKRWQEKSKMSGPCLTLPVIIRRQSLSIDKVHEQRGSKIASASTSCFLVMTGIKNSESHHKDMIILHIQIITGLTLSFFPLLINSLFPGFAGGGGLLGVKPFHKKKQQLVPMSVRYLTICSKLNISLLPGVRFSELGSGTQFHLLGIPMICIKAVLCNL